MAVLPVASTTFASALRAMSASTMRSLPLNAAVASGVMPERPGRLGSAPFPSNSATGACRLVRGGGVERGRPDEIARVDRRALAEEKLDERHVPRARRAGQRHGAE